MLKSCLFLLPVALFAMAGSVRADVTGTNSTTGNFDASSDTRVITFTGLEAGFGSGTILDVNVSINFAKADGQSFDPPFPGGTPFFNEIHFHLVSPNGTTVHLIEPSSWDSGSGQFDGTIVFDDEAALVVNHTTAPVAGTFRPTGPGALSDFDGENALGNWTLFIQDTVGLDSLRFRSYTLEIKTVPEPASIGLLALGAIGLAARFRRRRAAK